MRDKVPQMEYFFCDTGAELPETYEFLLKLESFLGKPVARLNSGRPRTVPMLWRWRTSTRMGSWI